MCCLLVCWAFNWEIEMRYLLLTVKGSYSTFVSGLKKNYLGELLWFHQYSLNSNFSGFRC